MNVHLQIQGIEEKHEVFILEVTQADLFEFSIHHRDALE